MTVPMLTMVAISIYLKIISRSSCLEKGHIYFYRFISPSWFYFADGKKKGFYFCLLSACLESLMALLPSALVRQYCFRLDSYLCSVL